MSLIIFTDLDGTLLDHDTYSWAPAEPALDALRNQQIPLVIASSKTASEVAPLRKRLGFEHCPAIVENGAGLLQPGGENALAENDDYRSIRQTLAAMSSSLRAKYKGFGDMSVEEIAAVTGLPPAEAKNAANRSFSEPGVWSGSDADRDRFAEELAARGIVARYGGRFLTLSLGGTKAGRMAEAAQLLGTPDAYTVGLGDAPNDIEMLEAADRGFIIHNPHGKPLPKLKAEDEKRVTRTKETGPTGWNTAVLSVLSQRTMGYGA